MSVSNPAAWDALVSALEEDLTATPNSELLAEALEGEIAALRTLVAGKLARRAESRRIPAPPSIQRRRAGSRLPRDPSERRALLRLMLSRPAARRLAVGFSEGREIPDQEVEKLLRLLLAADRFDDPS